MNDLITPKRKNAIFITGSHRSGSTWIGKTVSYSYWTHYIGEVFSPNSSLLDGLITEWFHYVTPQEAEQFTTAIKAILDFNYKPSHRKRLYRWLPSRLVPYRISRKLYGIPRPIIKDPIAALSAEWVARTFDMDVLYLVRHPAAFVLSLKKASWDYDYRSFLKQPQLIDDWLYPYMTLLNKPLGDVIEGGGILWLCIYHVLKGYAERNPGWHTWRFEDIALDPDVAFKEIYSQFGLEFTPRIAALIKEHTSSKNPVNAPENNPHLIERNSRALQTQWRSLLSPKELQRIRSIVEPVSCEYYGDVDW